MPAPRISVCMATYNGAAFVAEQLESVLAQLGPDDEVILVDDASTDATVNVVRSISDPRIRVIPQSVNAGHVRTFERAIQEASGDVLMLADQDDVWPAGRVALLAGETALSPFVAGGFDTFGRGEMRRVRLSEPAEGSSVRRLVRLARGAEPYYGCTMAFRAETRPLILPFPRIVEAHDHWIAVAALSGGAMRHVGQATVRRRIHGANVGQGRRRGIVRVAQTRLRLVGYLAIALWRRAVVRASARG